METTFSHAYSRLAALAAALLLACVAGLGQEADNVRIVDERRAYTVLPSGRVKVVEATTYEAQRADGRVLATAMFNEDISIDKASAPDAKPVYRSWEDEDLFYTGARICLLAVPLKKGKPAKVVFEQTYRAPEQFCNVFLTSPYATEHSLITVEIPASLAERYKVRPMNLDSCMTFSSEVGKNGNVIYSMNATSRPPFRYEEDAPSASVSAPQLIVTGCFADAGEVYRFFRGYCPDYDKEDAAVAALAKEITEDCATDMEKIDSIASWVRQNIRYVAVEHGEYGIRPAAAADVLARRYGDCKGSASLIKALLRQAGLDGRLVWIGTAGEVATRWDSVPSLQSGNHQIAAAVVADSIIYLDGTAAWSPAGYLPPSLRGQQAMIEDGEGFLLRTVPDEGIELDTDTLRGRFRIVGSDLRGTLERDMGGVRKMSVAGACQSLSAADRTRMLSGILAYPKKNATAHGARLELDGPAAHRCLLTCDSLVDQGAAKQLGDKIIVDLRPVRDLRLGTIDLKGRRRGLREPYGYVYAAHLELEIPEGYEAETLPERQDFDSPWYGGYIAYRVVPGRIVCEAEVRTRRTEAATSELAARNATVKAINRASESKIVLKKTIEN